jgi:hypothetical protein
MGALLHWRRKISGEPIQKPVGLFRKACLAETLGEQGEVLCSAKWCQVSQIGGAQIGITFEGPRHVYLCALKPPGERIAGCGYAYGQQESGIVTHYFFGA